MVHTTHSDPDGLGILLESWRTLGLPKEEMDLCLRVVSAVLHLGNLVFKQSADVSPSCILFRFIQADIIDRVIGSQKPIELYEVCSCHAFVPFARF